MSYTKRQDLESYIAIFLPGWPPSLAFWMSVTNHFPARIVKNFQDVLMEHWNVFSLPLPVDIFLCLLIVFMAEKVILKSEDSFRNAMVTKRHKVMHSQVTL